MVNVFCSFRNWQNLNNCVNTCSFKQNGIVQDLAQGCFMITFWLFLQTVLEVSTGQSFSASVCYLILWSCTSQTNTVSSNGIQAFPKKTCILVDIDFCGFLEDICLHIFFIYICVFPSEPLCKVGYLEYLYILDDIWTHDLADPRKWIRHKIQWFYSFCVRIYTFWHFYFRSIE